MGIRPQMYLVFGIDDFDGKLDYDAMEDSLELPESELCIEKFNNFYLRDAFMINEKNEWEQVYQHLYYDSEKQSKIIGYIVNRSRYDSDMIRALATVYSQFETNGKIDIPVMKREEHPLYANRVDNMHEIVRSDVPKLPEWQWSWFYPSVVEEHSLWPVHAFRAQYLFRKVGLDISPERYKAMLVWDWR